MLIVPRFMLLGIVVAGLLNLLTMHFYPKSWISDLFDLNQENNIPTWLASVYWLSIALAAMLCFVQAGAKVSRKTLPWLVVAAVFTGASCDEIAELHEQVGYHLQKPQLATGNPNYLSEGSPGSPWILFYSPFLVGAILYMVAFFFRVMPRRFFLYGCLGFVCFGIAIGCDYFQGMYDPYRQQIADFWHVNKAVLVDVSIFVEEILEMVGMTMITWALLGKYETQRQREQHLKNQHEQ